MASNDHMSNRFFTRFKNTIYEHDFDARKNEIVKTFPYRFLMKKITKNNDKLCQVVIEDNKYTEKTMNVLSISQNGLLQCVGFDGKMACFAEIPSDSRFFEAICKWNNLVAVSCFEAAGESGTKNIMFLYEMNEETGNFDLLDEIEINKKNSNKQK